MNTLDVIVTTLNKWSEEVFDNLLNKNALLYCFAKFGKLGKYNKEKRVGSIEFASGGKQIEEDIIINDNGNTAAVDYDEDLSVNATDVLGMAVFDWKIISTTAVAYDAQIAVNGASKSRKHSLVEAIRDAAETSILNKIASDMFNTANTKTLTGLPTLITDDGTGVVGGLDTNSYPLWKNQVQQLYINHTPAQLLQALGSLYRKCRSQTDVIVVGADLYGEIEAALTPFVQVNGFKKLEDAWFDYLVFHNAVILYDDNCPSNRAYFLDTSSIKFNVLSKEHKLVKVGDKERPAGSQKNIWPITTMLNFSVRNRRNLGVLVIAGNATYTVTAAAIANGGEDYAANDVLTIPGGTTNATIKVTAVDANGAITSATVLTGGVYDFVFSGPQSVTGGSGENATFVLSME